MKLNKNDLLESKLFLFVKKYWLYVTVALAVIIVGVSSIEIYREEVLEIDPDATYVEQDGLYFAAEPMDTLNPIVSTSEDVYYLSKLIYSSLFDYTDDLNVQGELVESYEVDTEKAYIDVVLRADACWEDGTPVSPGDVRFTVNAIKTYGSRGLYYESAAKISSVNVRGERELRIYFRNSYDCALDDLTFPILPEDEYSSARALVNDRENFEPKGSGQYSFVSYDSLEKLELAPNTNYFGEKATKTVTVNVLPDRSLASNMMEINDVTCYVDGSVERKSLVADKGFKSYDIVSNEVDFVVFNTRSEILSAPKVRQALAYAVDRNKILDNAYMGDGVLTDTIYYPDFLGVSDDVSLGGYNVEKAAELLAEAGYEDKNLNGRLEDGEGEEMTLTILVNSDNANRLAAARIIEDGLEDIGFIVNVTSAAWDEYTELIEKGDFDVLLTGYEMEASYDLREFFDGSNPWRYDNDELLSLVRELDRLHSAEEYKQIYEEIKAALIEENVYYPLCYRLSGLIGLSTFEAGKLPLFNDIYRNCQTWSWSVVSDQ